MKYNVKYNHKINIGWNWSTALTSYHKEEFYMKKFVAAAMSITMGMSLVSCGSSDTSNTKSNDTSKKTVGISMPAQNLERWNSDGEYLKSQFEAAGYEVKLTFAENDASKQNNDVLEMISDKVDLLLIAAVDGSSLSTPLEDAKAANIPVVSYDRLILDTDAVTYYVSFDNYLIGKLQAEYVIDQLHLNTATEPVNIEFVAGDEADNNARLFFKGAYDTMEEYIESGTVVVPSGMTTFERVATQDWTSENAEKNMKRVLKNYDNDTVLDAVICANDSTALGVTQAIESTYTGENYPVITGQDGDIANLKNMVDDKQAMTIFKNFDDEAKVAFEVCNKILQGETPTAKIASDLSIDVNFDSEMYNNGVKYVQSFLLVPTVITKDNLQIMVNAGLYKWDADNKYLELAD